MKKIFLIAITVLLFCGTAAFATPGKVYYDVDVKNFGEIFDYQGYTGLIIKLEIDGTEKWVKINTALDADRVLSIVMWAEKDNSKLTVTLDDFTLPIPELQYIKLNQADFEY